MCREWLKIVSLLGQLVYKGGENLERFVRLNLKSLIGIFTL